MRKISKKNLNCRGVESVSYGGGTDTPFLTHQGRGFANRLFFFFFLFSKTYVVVSLIWCITSDVSSYDIITFLS